MNPYDELSTLVEAIVRGSTDLTNELNPDNPGWMDVGIPVPASDPNATYPCIRFDGLVAQAGKYNTYTVNVHLWSQDMSVAFFDLADAFATSLQTSNQILCESYMHRPETGLNSILVPVTFYA